MEVANLIIILGAVLLVSLLSGIWVAASLFLVAFIALVLNENSNIGLVMATTTWGASATWTLAALPLFIWMGEILFRTKLSEDLFHGLAPWLNKVPGRLLHVNILGCTIFAAVSGSSAATAATIGKMTIPELTKRGYPIKMMIGTLAGSGTLGFLIPPSIILIVYGVSAEVSISRLFIAGVLPGIMLVTLFMGYTAVWSMLNKDKIPSEDDTELSDMTLEQKLYATRRLFPVMGLILFVLGSIYAGWATATEAAALGVFGALFLSLVTGNLSLKTVKESLLGATRTSCMITFIIAGAAFLSLAMGFTGIPRMLAENISSMGLTSTELIIVLTLFFMVLGFFLDGISMVVLTTSIVLPMVEKSGIDLMWFGIYVVLVVEMSQITPPVGFNLFVMQGLTKINILKIAGYALPFFFLLLTAIVLLTIFPEIATWLPELMTRK
ncbi:MAG TPA: TRAP transporter large permease subunit [Leucothrix sp.]|nr:TRAP transporter large permease subunit [Leucothrix sp.]HIQ16033.1 TRAP transporter large permease subunit [Leucothrix sp.]